MKDFLGCSKNQANETVVVFGDYSHLVGVVARPESVESLDTFAVLIITAGMLPSSGPFRLHVDLAGSLVNESILSLRFDLSGIGESFAVGTCGSSLERAANEISAAVDYLSENYGITQVALFGLCSGADDALYAALQDKRIVGLFCVDGCGYRTAKFYVYRCLQNYLPKLLSPKAWGNRIRRKIASRQTVPESLQPGFDVREFPDRDTAASQLSELIERGLAMHFHYTGGVGQYYNYEQQFAEMFYGTELASNDRLNKISTSFAPWSDHVAFLTGHRQALVQLAVNRFKTTRDQLPAGLRKQTFEDSRQLCIR